MSSEEPCGATGSSAVPGAVLLSLHRRGFDSARLSADNPSHKEEVSHASHNPRRDTLIGSRFGPHDSPSSAARCSGQTPLTPPMRPTPRTERPSRRGTKASSRATSTATASSMVWTRSVICASSAGLRWNRKSHARTLGRWQRFQDRPGRRGQPVPRESRGRWEFRTSRLCPRGVRSTVT